MKKTTLLFCTLAAGSALFSCSAPQQETAATDYTQYVNTFIGAADNGHTDPDAWPWEIFWSCRSPETVIGHGTAIAALSRRIAKVRLLVIIPLRSTNRV